MMSHELRANVARRRDTMSACDAMMMNVDAIVMAQQSARCRALRYEEELSCR